MSIKLRTALKVGEHLLVALVAGGGVLLLTAGLWLQNADSPVASEAMVVLAGNFTRPAYAAELYQLGLARKVYVGRVHRKAGECVLDQNFIAYPREEEMYKAVLRRKGVPPEAVEYYGDDLVSTAQEAESLARQLGREGPGRLLVVTSPSHVLRARMIFADAFPGWEVRVVATPWSTSPQSGGPTRTPPAASFSKYPRSSTICWGAGSAPPPNRAETKRPAPGAGRTHAPRKRPDPREKPLSSGSRPQPRELAALG